MRLYRPFPFADKIFPRALFRMRSDEKALCLTFDDGPDRDSTVRILEILDGKNVKAMFFMTGCNAVKYPDLKNLIVSNGHVPGNHGYMHLNGWWTPADEYVDNVLRGGEFTTDKFFRPPYGHLRLSQYRKLSELTRIVFWDVMPYDFDSRISSRDCLENLNRMIRQGSVIVLHDKPRSTVFNFLGEFITTALDKGYKFVIPQ